jgi:hypothetical protein
MSRRERRRKQPPAPQTVSSSNLASAWDRYWFGPVAAIRPYLLMKAVLILLAFDVWVLRVKNGAHYSGNAFNVAHFSWLDALQPEPTASLYTGLLLFIGFLALLCVFTVPNRIAMAVLALSYTYSWMLSMLDGYQHHYFLSLVLLAFIFFPLSRARDLYDAPPDTPTEGPNTRQLENSRASAWAYALVGVNVAIMYFFTAVTKATDDRFLNGEIIQQLSQKNQILQPVEAWLERIAAPPHLLWEALAIGTIAVEILLAVIYVPAVRQDDSPRRWLQPLSWAGFVAVILFHGIGNEFILALRIGWFSYYMIALGSVYLLPESFLWALVRLISWPVVRLSRAWSSLSAALARRRFGLATGFNVVCAITGAAIIVIIGLGLDLPGAMAACSVLALGLVIITAVSYPLRRQGDAMRYVFAGSLTAGLMWTSVTFTMVRFDYYDQIGFYHRSRGELQAAIEAYEKAIRYVPTGRRQIPQPGAPEPRHRAPGGTQQLDDLIIDGN